MSVLGKVRSNFVGSEFVCYNTGTECNPCMEIIWHWFAPSHHVEEKTLEIFDGYTTIYVLENPDH